MVATSLGRIGTLWYSTQDEIGDSPIFRRCGYLFPIPHSTFHIAHERDELPLVGILRNLRCPGGAPINLYRPML